MMEGKAGQSSSDENDLIEGLRNGDIRTVMSCFYCLSCQEGLEMTNIVKEVKSSSGLISVYHIKCGQCDEVTLLPAKSRRSKPKFTVRTRNAQDTINDEISMETEEETFTGAINIPLVTPPIVCAEKPTEEKSDLMKFIEEFERECNEWMLKRKREEENSQSVSADGLNRMETSPKRMMYNNHFDNQAPCG